MGSARGKTLRYMQACVFKEHLRARPGWPEQVSFRKQPPGLCPPGSGVPEGGSRGLGLCCEPAGGRSGPGLPQPAWETARPAEVLPVNIYLG